MLRILTLLMGLLAGSALAQPLPTTKPPPLGAPTAPMAPAAPGPASGGLVCAAPLANACLTQQSACQMACPGIWSMNPNAPAFTPTDRAGCMQQCMHRYLACRRLHGC